MARFELRFKPSVAKDLRGIPKTEVRRLLKRIEALGNDPRPAGCEKLTGRELYRIRQGIYRIVYSVDDAAVVIEVIEVGHRREVYRIRDQPG
jgi:mRNA interferase RelE/StbE